MTPVFGVTGWKNSGKTTLVTRLIAELTRRGYRVNSIKHAHHAFDIDIPGTDSFRHREAGATEVAIVSGTRWALMHEVRPADSGDAEPTMDEIIARLSPADLVLVEGYKRESHPKIECRLGAEPGKAPLSANDPMIVAIAANGAADHPADTGDLPRFDLDAVADIADFIVAYHALPAPRRSEADAAQTA
jgi:molybdopterin-guanine dinucleotide biosynthesis protein B